MKREQIPPAVFEDWAEDIEFPGIDKWAGAIGAACVNDYLSDVDMHMTDSRFQLYSMRYDHWIDMPTLEHMVTMWLRERSDDRHPDDITMNVKDARAFAKQFSDAAERLTTYCAECESALHLARKVP